MGTPERRPSRVRIYVDFQIDYHTKTLLQLNLLPSVTDSMRNTVFELIGATRKEQLLPLAAEVDTKRRLKKSPTCVEDIEKKYKDLTDAQKAKPERDRLSDRIIVNSLKPDLAEELGEVRLDSPHKAYLASALRRIMTDANTTEFAGKTIETDTSTNEYL